MSHSVALVGRASGRQPQPQSDRIRDIERDLQAYLYSKEVIMEPKTEQRNYKLFGEAHPSSKLTRDQVIEIRREAKVPDTSRAWLARKYGVSRSCVDRILAGETWRECL
jgi:hypothetical protein